LKQNNKIMLITYADSLGRDLPEMNGILKEHFPKAVGAVHILPFFPSSADRGFAPMRYDMVDPAFGSFEDVDAIGENFPLMFDFMINHISRSSEYFRDYLAKKDASEFKDMFIRFSEFWENGDPTEEDIARIYKRKPRAPYTDAHFADGSTEKIWCTFDEEQIDLDVASEKTKAFVRETLAAMCSHRLSFVRLDAFAYAVKKAGTDCFFVEPEIWELLHAAEKIVEPYGVEILPEIHEHYTIQLKIAQKGFWVYDFALPMLLLHALYTGRPDRLLNWFTICPRKQFTTLDTHDGIGVVDVVGLLTEEEIEETKTLLFEKGANVKKKYNTAEYNNLDIYQINCTYYSALGNNDQAYLLARAIQFFAPGVPQVYYVGMLSGENDIERMEKTKQGRDINRHVYTREEVADELRRPVNQKLRRLMELRNSCDAFEGDFTAERFSDFGIRIIRTSGNESISLTADLKTHAFSIIRTVDGSAEEICL